MTKVSPLGAMVPGGAATGGGPSKSPESVTLLGRVICDDHLSGPKRGRSLEELLKLWQFGIREDVGEVPVTGGFGGFVSESRQ